MDFALPDRGECGFWSNDGILGVWLLALANGVPTTDEPWLNEAAEHWRLHGVQQFMGCMDGGLDKYLTSAERVAAATEIAVSARASLVGIAEDGYVPLHWLIANDWDKNWELAGSFRGVLLDDVLQVADAFIALLAGRISTTAATSPVLPEPSGR